MEALRKSLEMNRKPVESEKEPAKPKRAAQRDIRICLNEAGAL